MLFNNKTKQIAVRLKKKSFVTGLVLICICASNCLASTENDQENIILLGMSTALTGPAAALGKNMLDGVNAGFYRINQQGGINNQKFKVIALDDGYEPHLTVPNMRRLIDKHKVLAIIGNVGTPTAIAAIPIANDKKTLLFAPYSGAGVLRKKPPDRYVINYRASYAQETAAMIGALVNHAGIKPEEIAFFTQRDGYGDAGFNGGIVALKRYGLKNEYSIVHTRYERNTVAVENSVADILLSSIHVRAIIMVGAYEPSAKFIKLAKKNGIDALFLNVSFVGSAPLAESLGNDIENVIVTQVVPHPEDMSLEIVRNFQQDIAAMDPVVSPTFSAMEGYIASQILVRSLASFVEIPNRESIIDALEDMGEFDMGLGVDLILTNTDHQACKTIWPTVLSKGKFKSFAWEDINQYMP